MGSNSQFGNSSFDLPVPHSAIRNPESASSPQPPGSPAPLRKICVLGLGYIGLPTAAVLATHGYRVIGVDVDDSVVNTVNGGNTHIEEPGLQTLVQAAYKSGNLRAQSSPEAADAFIMAVPTPLKAGEQRSGRDPVQRSKGSGVRKQADLNHIESAVKSIVPVLKSGDLVILESTVPPTTTEQVVRPLLEETGMVAGKDFHLAHCPERVLPGRILEEIVENDRIIGGITPESARQAKLLYETFVSGQLHLTDATAAEMVKIMENTFRDVNIALANELARICMKLGKHSIHNTGQYQRQARFAVASA